MNARRHNARRAQELEELIGVECALPSRELRLAHTAPAPTRSLWRRALGWLRIFGPRPGAAA